MSIEFAIQPVMHGPGYEVVRTADNVVLTTVATAGEASQYIHNRELERAYDLERTGDLYIKPESDPAPNPPADIKAWIDRHLAAEQAEQIAIARECDQAIADHRAAQPSAPAPDEDEEDILIGHIDGCAVTGHYSDETPHEFYWASMTWNGLGFSTDGDSYIHLDLGNALEGGEGLAAEDLGDLGCGGDMHLHEWGKVKALAHTDVVERLIALARTKAQQ